MIYWHIARQHHFSGIHKFEPLYVYPPSSFSSRCFCKSLVFLGRSSFFGLLFTWRPEDRVTSLTDSVTVVKPWQHWHSRPSLLKILLSFVIVSSFCRLRSWMELKILSRWFLPIKTTKLTRSVDQRYAYLIC